MIPGPPGRRRSHSARRNQQSPAAVATLGVSECGGRVPAKRRLVADSPDITQEVAGITGLALPPSDVKWTRRAEGSGCYYLPSRWGASASKHAAVQRTPLSSNGFTRCRGTDSSAALRNALPVTGRIHFRRDRHVKQRGRGEATAHWPRCGTEPRTAKSIFRPLSSEGRADIARSPAPLPGGRTNRRKHRRWYRFHTEGRS
jgi:hypothetical protein